MPKLMNFRKYPYTADAWNHSSGISELPSGYSFLREVRFNVGQGVFGRLTCFFPDDASDILPRARLHNFRDGDGNELYPNGIWILDDYFPVVNIYGRREGFVGAATLELIEGGL